MGKNTKPMLTVLVEGDKLQQFRDYALSKEVSMGWVVNRLLDRVLSGELDVMGDTVSIGTTREYPYAGLTRENVENIVKSSIDNQLVDSNRDYIEELVKSCIGSLDIFSTGTNDLKQTTIASIEVALETVKESVSELETYTQSQFAAVRDELKAIADLAVGMPAPVNTTTIPQHRNPQATSYPEWVKTNERGFYSLLVDNSELLDKVAEAIDLNPKDNVSLAVGLLELGIHKQDGTALDSSPISRIRKVVKQLKITQETPLPLFQTND